MEKEWRLAEECLDGLIDRRGPAAPAWVNRTHRALIRLCPGAYVFRLDEDLDDMVRWMEAAGVKPEGDALLPCLTFDLDRDGALFTPDGGWCAFRWNDREYQAVGVHIPGSGYSTWVACADRPAAELLVDAVGRHTWKRSARVMIFEDGDWEEAPRLEEDLSSYTWESVVLPEPTLVRLRRATELFFQSEHIYSELEIPWKLGYLLVGPPGTGKTLTTKVLAATCGVPFLYVRSLTGYNGVNPTNSTIHRMFQGARERAPCMLCLEDVDSLVTEDLRSTFLNELDGIEEDYRGVLTVATTNHPEKLDAALLHRPSRFDYRFEFPLPEDEQRRDYVRSWVEKLSRMGYVTAPEEGLEAVVRRSRGMSIAYLKRVMMGAVMRMHTLEERGDEAFTRLALEELADAVEDRSLARRMETASVDGAGGPRVGFRLD
jgi:hypothetical protein